MSMIDLFACLFAQHPTCHWCLSALCWWVRCSCPLLPAISSCGRGLLVCACVGLAGGLVLFGCFFPLFVGVVWSLRRPSAVCFLGVVVLASAAAAALHQCAVYLGAVHFTKSTQTEVVIGVFCNTAIENAGADKELASIKQVYTKSNQVPGRSNVDGNSSGVQSLQFLSGKDLSLFDQQILAGSFLGWGFQHQHAPSESVN